MLRSNRLRAPRRPLLLVSAAWLVPAILGGLEAYAQARLGNREGQVWRSVVFEAGDWLFYGALTPAVFWLARRFPLRRGLLARAIPVHFAASLLLCGCGPRRVPCFGGCFPPAAPGS